MTNFDDLLRELPVPQGKAFFDRRCRRILGVGAAEFIREYDAGTAEDRWAHDRVSELQMLIPFYRHVSGEYANATAQQCESCGGTAEPFRKINGVELCFDCWAKWGTVDEEEA